MEARGVTTLPYLHTYRQDINPDNGWPGGGHPLFGMSRIGRLQIANPIVTGKVVQVARECLGDIFLARIAEEEIVLYEQPRP